MTPFRMFSIFIIDSNRNLLSVEKERINKFFLSLQQKFGNESLTLYFSNPVKYRNILEEIHCANKCIGNNVDVYKRQGKNIACPSVIALDNVKGSARLGIGRHLHCSHVHNPLAQLTVDGKALVQLLSCLWIQLGPARNIFLTLLILCLLYTSKLEKPVQGLLKMPTE